MPGRKEIKIILLIALLITAALIAITVPANAITYTDNFVNLNNWNTAAGQSVSGGMLVWTGTNQITSKINYNISIYDMEMDIFAPNGCELFGALASSASHQGFWYYTNYYAGLQTLTGTSWGTYTISGNEWHHIRFYRNANYETIYIDGNIAFSKNNADDTGNYPIYMKPYANTGTIYIKNFYLDTTGAQYINDYYNLMANTTTLYKGKMDTEYQINITRQNADGIHNSTVDYQFINGTAHYGEDFEAAAQTGTLNFSATDTYKLLNFTVKGNSSYTINENRTFTFQLSNPTYGVTLGDINQTVYTIVDYERIVDSHLWAVDAINHYNYIDHCVEWHIYNPYYEAWQNYSAYPYLIQGVQLLETRLGDTLTVNITSPDDYYHNITENVIVDRDNGSYRIALWPNNSSGAYVYLMGRTRDQTGSIVGGVKVDLQIGGTTIDTDTSNTDGYYTLAVHRDTPTASLTATATYNGMQDTPALFHLEGDPTNKTSLAYPDDMLQPYAGGGVGDTQCDIILQYATTPTVFNYNFRGSVYTIYQNGTYTNLTTLYPGTIAKIEIRAWADNYGMPGDIVATGYTDAQGHYNFNGVLNGLTGYDIFGNPAVAMFYENVSAPNYQASYIAFAAPNGAGTTKDGSIYIYSHNFVIFPVSYGNTEGPLTDFTAQPRTGSPPLTVYFTDLSTNGPTQYYWDFGDGSTSTEKNPTHVYNTVGSFTVIHQSANFYGWGHSEKAGYISTYGSITFDGYTRLYDDNSLLPGATITIIDDQGDTAGTCISNAQAYYSVTVNDCTPKTYSLRGTMDGYSEITYTGLIYPDVFTDSELTQDVYFFEPVPTGGPTGEPGEGTTYGTTIDDTARQDSITQSGDLLAGGLGLFAMLVFLGIITAIIGRMLQ